MPVNCSSTDLDCLSRWNDKNGTGSCPTKWPFDFLQPRKSLDGNRTCHWIDLIEATGGGSHKVSKALFAICVLTILFNILLFAVILSKKELRQQRNNLFLISIGASDVANALYLLVMNKPSLNPGRFLPMLSNDPVTCKLHQIVSSFFFCAPWWLFIGLMFDRLYAVKRPMDYRKRGLHSKGLRSILACWLFTLLPGVPLWFDETIAEDLASGCKCYFPLRNTVWLIYSVVIAFALPVVLILISWVTLAHHFFLNPSSELRNATLKLIFISALFLTTIFPFCLQFVKAISATPCITSDIDKTILFVLVNSLVQPVLCLTILTQIRREAWRLLTCQPSKAEMMRSLTREGTTLGKSSTLTRQNTFK